MTWLALLGSTGSIGQQTLSVLATSQSGQRVFALTAHHNDELLFAQCQRHQPQMAVMIEPEAAARLTARCQQVGLSTQIYCGAEYLDFVSAHAQVDTVVNGIVGYAGLAPTFAAIQAGKRLLLANKEVCVVAGELFTRALSQSTATCFPLDSEHHALYELIGQKLPLAKHHSDQIESVILTASGGPFVETDLATLATVTPAQACAHPNWSMGQKISVDSATLVNKAFEVIEAHYLFQLPIEKIRVFLHPQSTVHAMVNYIDGSMKMHLATPDMRLSISRGLFWPDYVAIDIPPISLQTLNSMQFREVDDARYPSFRLIIDALRANPHTGVIINAANEIAVAAYLAGRIHFTDIHRTIAYMVNDTHVSSCQNLSQIKAADAAARSKAQHFIDTKFKHTKEPV